MTGVSQRWTRLVQEVVWVCGIVCLLLRVPAALAAPGPGAAAAGDAPRVQALAPPATASALVSAYRLHPSPETLFQLGMSAFAEAKTLAAYDLVRRALADPTLTNLEALQVQAQGVLHATLPAHGEAEIQGPRGAIVLVDDRVVGVLPLAQPVMLPPGSHRLGLDAHGRVWNTQAELPEGRVVNIRFDLDSGAVAITTPPAVLVLADATKAAPFPPELWRTVEHALRSAGLSRASLSSAFIKLPAKYASCLDSLSCQVQLGSEKGCDFVLIVRAARQENDWKVRHQLVDIAVGDVAAAGEVECHDCLVAALSQRLALGLAQPLQEGSTRPRGEIALTSHPVGATVYRGEVALGRTPLKRAAFTGDLRLELRLFGHQPTSVALSVGENQTAQAEIELPPLPGRNGRPRWRLIVGGVLLGAGVLTAAYGAGALGVNGMCGPDAGSMGSPCGQTYVSLFPGAALTAAGLAVGIGGVVLLAWPPRQN